MLVVFVILQWPITNVISCSNVLEEQPNHSQRNYTLRTYLALFQFVLWLLHSEQMTKDQMGIALDSRGCGFIYDVLAYDLIQHSPNDRSVPAGEGQR